MAGLCRNGRWAWGTSTSSDTGLAPDACSGAAPPFSRHLLLEPSSLPAAWLRSVARQRPGEGRLLVSIVGERWDDHTLRPTAGDPECRRLAAGTYSCGCLGGMATGGSWCAVVRRWPNPGRASTYDRRANSYSRCHLRQPFYARAEPHEHDPGDDTSAVSLLSTTRQRASPYLVLVIDFVR